MSLTTNELRLGRRGLSIAGASSQVGPISVAPAGWWKADAITGLADGAAVSSWLDSSGNSNPLVQATGGNQPAYRTSGINGLPVVDYAFGARYLDAAGFTVSQPDTIFLVVQAALATGDLPIIDGISARQLVGFDNASGKHIYFAGTARTGTAATGTAARYISALFNGASSGFWVNGAADSTANPGTDALTGLRVGSYTDASLGWDGYIAEILVYASALSTPNRQAVESYLAGKYAL